MEFREKFPTRKRIHTAGMHSVFCCAHCKGDILPGQTYEINKKGEKTHLNPECAKAVSECISEPMPDFWNPNELIKGRDRLLRTYFRDHAEKTYICHACFNKTETNNIEEVIFVGEPYYAEVWIINGKLKIRRFHQTCLDPDDEPYDRHKRKRENKDLPLAA